MTVTLRQPVEPASLELQLKDAMRHMAGGVSVITCGTGEGRTGLTATSATSLSVDPPRMLICVNRTASAWAAIQAHRHFAVNILADHHEDVAAKFAGRDGVKGAARYEGADWLELGSGAWGLRGALAVLDCEVEEILERHSHGIVIGAVTSVQFGAAPGSGALVYAQGRFSSLRLG